MRIHEHKSIEERVFSKIRRGGPDNCWQWIGGSSGGYESIRLEPPNGNIKVRVHRWMWEYKYGAIPDGMEVCHKCDNTLCVNPAHLFLGTQLDNVRDCIAKHRFNAGGKNAKLTHDDVVNILQMIASGRKLSKIAKSYGVSKSAIKAIKYRVTYVKVERNDSI